MAMSNWEMTARQSHSQAWNESWRPSLELPATCFSRSLLSRHLYQQINQEGSGSKPIEHSAAQSNVPTVMADFFCFYLSLSHHRAPWLPSSSPAETPCCYGWHKLWLTTIMQFWQLNMAELRHFPAVWVNRISFWSVTWYNTVYRPQNLAFEGLWISGCKAVTFLSSLGQWQLSFSHLQLLMGVQQHHAASWMVHSLNGQKTIH